MLAYLLGLIFPPKLGKINGVDDVVLLHAIHQGKVTVYEAEPPDSGVGRIWEWPEGRWREGHRIR
jgi:hypothetical protein